MACSDDVQVPVPCGEILKCGDVCAGTFDECLRGRLHKKCEQDCKRILICGHECKDKCWKPCPPCENICENRCVHGRCGQSKITGSKTGRKCSEPCLYCTEPCTWSCEHHQCNLRCFEPCTRKRCNEPCKKKKTTCGHDCIGVCGEECPDLCRQCDPEKYNEVLEQQNRWYPIEDDKKDTAKFVQLDCGHLFEIKCLDQCFEAQIGQMKENDGSTKIKLLQCPLCNSEVRTTQRYGSITKQCLLDIEKVKAMGRGYALGLKEQQAQLARKLDSIVVRGTTPVHGNFKTAQAALKELLIKPDLNKNRLISIYNLAGLLEEMIRFKGTDMRKLERQAVHCGPTGLFTSGPINMNMMEQVKGIDREISFLATWIVNNAESCSQQMIGEFANECRRTMVFAQLIEVLMQIKLSGKEDIGDSCSLMVDVMEVLNGTIPFNTDLEKIVKENIKNIRRVCVESEWRSGQGRVEIPAMNSTTGRWFKCQNGHIYCIGQGGGAMEEKKCPECKATIGEEGHRLRADNTVASEMDGARQAAYALDADFAYAMRLQNIWKAMYS